MFKTIIAKQPTINDQHRVICELCGFEPKTKNKRQDKEDHIIKVHFKAELDKVFSKQKYPRKHKYPSACPFDGCSYQGNSKRALHRHYANRHILKGPLKRPLVLNNMATPRVSQNNRKVPKIA